MIYYLVLILLSLISTKSIQNPIPLSEALEMLGACSFDEKIKIIENNGVSIFQSKIENITEGSLIIAYENFLFYA